jgi:hypothetical protein
MGKNLADTGVRATPAVKYIGEKAVETLPNNPLAHDYSMICPKITKYPAEL